MDRQGQSEEIEITIVVTRRQAGRLAAVLKRAAKKEPDSETAWKFREILFQIKEKGGIPYWPTKPVSRPPDDDEVALRRVIRGEEPYPVLSHADAHRALLALTGKVSVREIGDRLFVSDGTVRRWRRERQSGKRTESDD